MIIDFYTAHIKEISIPVTDTVCRQAYAVYRMGHYTTPDGYIHRLYDELFNVYSDRDVAEAVVELIENQ